MGGQIAGPGSRAKAEEWHIGPRECGVLRVTVGSAGWDNAPSAVQSNPRLAEPPSFVATSVLITQLMGK